MQFTYEQVLQVVEELKIAKLQAADLSATITLERHELDVIKAKIERGLIRKVGGEKKLAPTVEDRERIFIVACDADGDYKRRWKALHDKRLTSARSQIEIEALDDKLKIMMEALQSEQHDQDTQQD